MTHPSRRLVLLAPLLAAACASSDPVYYSLAPVPGTPQGGGPRTVEIRRPGLAGYLDRPEIVRSGTDYRLQVASGERWGEPFGDLVARVLAEDLTGRLPGTAVFTSTGAISSESAAAVELDLQRFDLDAGGTVVLLAQVSVTRGRGSRWRQAQGFRLQRMSVPPGTPGLVATMSGLVGELADGIAAILRRLPATGA